MSSGIAFTVSVLEAFKMGLLHRSIGYSSVRARYYGVLGRWIGILSDWNACAHINAPYSKIRDRIERWEFLSIEHLEDPSKTHDIMDDLQTLFWVLLWTVIHHFDSSSSATSFNPEIFSEKHSVLIDGKSQDIGGRMKRQFLVKGHEILDLVEPIQSASLMWLLTKMSTHWGQYYRLKAKLAGVEIRGVQNALCLAKTRAGPSLPASEEQVSAAREFAGKYVEVSDPEFWIGMCTEAIAMDMWVMDAMPLGLLAGAYSGGVRSSYDAAADDVVPVNGSEEAHPGTFTVEFDAGEADKESAGAPKSVHCDERPISKDPRNESEENLEQNEHRPDKRSREEGDFNDENNTNDSGMRRKRVRQSGQSEEGEHSKTLPPLPRECKGHAQLVRTDSEQLVADVIHKLKVRPHESALKRGAAEDVASGMVDGAAGDQSSSALKGCIGATAIELEESAVSRGE
ncbi:hypothetical protein BDY19DRAFT_663841 [Irpex rosettiformis]|uniref:Uncharacterized protein n=1 Tax=Irpex rosettiformis TaxID=378272 RepID=A0ACB8U9K3_9APHY|nr:hypothetical protein BDY19DRAFT_663841 [Irpex rosettiformis]